MVSEFHSEQPDPTDNISYVGWTVYDFADAMIERLRELNGKPGKDGWRHGEGNTSEELLRRAMNHLPAVSDTVTLERDDLLDIANYMMMIWDRSRNHLS